MKDFDSINDLEDERMALRQAVSERDGQIANLNQAVAERDSQIASLAQEIAVLRNSTSWRLTKLLRFVGHQIARGKHLVRIAPSAFRMGGGPRATLKKVISLYRREGFSGIKRGIRMVQTSGLVNPSVGSGEFDRNDYGEWVRRYDTIDDSKRQKLKELCDGLASKPKISVVMPTYNPKPEWLIEAIESVRNQIYPNWELCIADDASPDPSVPPILERYMREDQRIKVVFREQNGHISAASNSALGVATGEWVALLDHDDLLTEHALYHVAETILAHPDVALIYSDEDKIDPDGRRYAPYFKCGWNIDLFYSQNMFSHLGVYLRSLLDEIGGFRLGLEGAQDYDLALRCVERVRPEQIRHVPRVLYHWRVHPGSTALTADAKPYAMIAGERAINEHFKRTGVRGRVELIGFGYRAHYDLPEPRPLVSIVIPTRNARALVRQCIDSIRAKTTYPAYEILLIDNGSDELESLQEWQTLAASGVRVLRDDGPFNFAALNNRAVAEAKGEIVALVNNDTEVLEPKWLDIMVAHALRPGVGAVGARLLYPNRSIQHAGVVLGMGGAAGHAHYKSPPFSHGYFGRIALTSAFSAVTAACLVVRRDLYLQVGGLDEVNLQVAFNDIDFCLRLGELGHRSVYVADAVLYHHESASRGAEDDPVKHARFERETAWMRRRWERLINDDPYYSPNLTLEHADFSLAWPPRIDH